ncbi:MAG TPA: DUF4347 domain-containing protein, partial [Trichocoleus sp.]
MQTSQSPQSHSGPSSNQVPSNPTQGAPNPQHLIFIDAAVDDYQSLLPGLIEGAEVIVLDSDQNGIEQITSALAQRSDIASVQILSHGSEGSLSLGNTQLNADNVNDYSTQLAQWRSALTEEADILLLGCNVAVGEHGQAFVQQLSQITGADVAASDDLTGNSDQGGDWALEFAAGLIDAPLALQMEALQAYESVLVDFSVGTTEQLRQAIVTARNNGIETRDRIFLTNNISVATTDLPVLDSSLEIDGNGFTISGGGRNQILEVNLANSSTSVHLRDLTLADGLAQGGNGSSGGGGGLGAGAALFVNQGNVIVEDVNFFNNRALGGNGTGAAGSGGSGGNDSGSGSNGSGGGNGGGSSLNSVGVGGGGGGRGGGIRFGNDRDAGGNGSNGSNGSFGAGGGGAGGAGGGAGGAG